MKRASSSLVMVTFEVVVEFFCTHAPFAQDSGEQVPRTLDPKEFDKDSQTIFGVDRKRVYVIKQKRSRNPNAMILLVALLGPGSKKAPIL